MSWPMKVIDSRTQPFLQTSFLRYHTRKTPSHPRRLRTVGYGSLVLSPKYGRVVSVTQNLVSMAAPKYCVILHAGTTECWETSPSRQQEIEQTLHNIAKSAGSRLASGAKALDVVQFVVSALEDCPLFNAGKGAVLNEDGKHEVGSVHSHPQKLLSCCKCRLNLTPLLARSSNRRRSFGSIWCCSLCAKSQESYPRCACSPGTWATHLPHRARGGRVRSNLGSGDGPQRLLYN